ncbi:MAG: GNAT family N-acetyltransferase [Acidimicrobiales bacterium]|jgi:ribosomal protein S18 acetylase RimI-like enzyme
MEANGILIDRAGEVTDDLAEAVARLVPQLSSTAAPPSRTVLEEIVASPSSSLLIARLGEDSSRIAGMLTLIVYRIPTSRHAVIEDVVVDEWARGRGVGEALVTDAVRRARELGALHVNLTSRSTREAANRLYGRVGFVRRDTNVYRFDLGG